MIAYLDTNLATWLVDGDLRKISTRAQEHLRSHELLLSPMVLLELEYLSDIGRVRFPAGDALLKLAAEANVRVCDLPFSRVADVALREKWTRDPFDRLIVANAKVNGFAPLLSADRNIRENYSETIW